MDIIENIYLKNNFPGYETLYKLVKAENNDIKKKMLSKNIFPHVIFSNKEN